MKQLFFRGVTEKPYYYINKFRIFPQNAFFIESQYGFDSSQKLVSIQKIFFRLPVKDSIVCKPFYSGNRIMENEVWYVRAVL